MIILHLHEIGIQNLVELSDNQHLAYVPESLPEHRRLIAEAFVFAAEELRLANNQPQPVRLFPVPELKPVRLVPQVLQVFLFSHSGPPRRLPVRHHAPTLSVVYTTSLIATGPFVFKVIPALIVRTGA